MVLMYQIIWNRNRLYCSTAPNLFQAFILLLSYSCKDFKLSAMSNTQSFYFRYVILDQVLLLNWKKKERKRMCHLLVKFWKISATSSHVRKQAIPLSRICFLPLSVITSPFCFTITSFGIAVILYLFFNSLKKERE